MTFFLLYVGNRQKPRRKFGKNFFFWRSPEKNFGNFFLGGENACALCSWPREGLSSRSMSFALASKVASSTPPL